MKLELILRNEGYGIKYDGGRIQKIPRKQREGTIEYQNRAFAEFDKAVAAYNRFKIGIEERVIKTAHV